MDELAAAHPRPGGAIPKDGPSVGVTIVTAVVSMLTEKLVWNDTAMTGEISLRGVVLPVGGTKEKVIATHRMGMRQICIPAKARARSGRSSALRVFHRKSG